MFLFAQNPLFRIATPPMFSVLVIYWVSDPCVYQIDKKMTECCTNFCCLPDPTGLPIVCGQQKHCPIPFPLPLFSPMGRLLSSWPAHGEKRGKGEGDGALVSVCTELFA